MTTKELTETIVYDLMAEIPIESRKEEMFALINGHVERYRQQMVDTACKLLCKTCNITSGGAILKECNYKPCYRYNGFRKAMLNENKE